MEPHFFAYMYRLRYIKRWSLMRNLVSENVAEHSYQVAILTHALCTIANEVYGKSIETEKAVCMALFHDATESFTGDIPTPVKHRNPDMLHNFRKIEQGAAEKLIEMVPEALRHVYRPLVCKGHLEGDHADDSAPVRASVAKADAPAAAVADADAEAGRGDAAVAARTDGRRNATDADIIGIDMERSATAAGEADADVERDHAAVRANSDVKRGVTAAGADADDERDHAAVCANLDVKRSATEAGADVGHSATVVGADADVERSEWRAYVKAADLLDAYLKCASEVAAGNGEFATAKEQIQAALDKLGMPETTYFMRHLAPSFEKTLDEMTVWDE